MVRVALICPGSTSFDEEGRIKGCLDIPLSETGKAQAKSVAEALAAQLQSTQPPLAFSMVYAGPCQSARATAEVIGEHCRARVRVIDCLANIDHGLWQGKLIDEVKRLQPRVYRQIQESPETFAPPRGETLEEAEARIRNAIAKLVKKHRNEIIAIVVPNPLASLVRRLLVAGELGDLWKAEQDFGAMEMITVESKSLLTV